MHRHIALVLAPLCPTVLAADATPAAKPATLHPYAVALQRRP